MKGLFCFWILLIQTIIYSQTADSVYLELKKQNVKHPEIVLAQSIEETGWYKCTYCSLSKKNIFGFRYKKQYLKFDNWQESIAYYKRWQNKYYIEKDHKNYYDFLIWKGFATNPKYINNIKNITKSLELWD